MRKHRRWRDDPLDHMSPWWRAPLIATGFVLVAYAPALWAIWRGW